MFSKELRKYVNDEGLVNYSKWKEERQGLDNYLDLLSKLSNEEYKSFSRLEKRSLWLNAYNALAIKLVLDHYPIKGEQSKYPKSSIRQIPGTWDAVSSKVAGQDLTLYGIVHDKLRKAKDCRTHFAIVPASKGGGRLQRKAFQARTVLDDLARLQKEYLGKPANLCFDKEKQCIVVSQIFKWFPLDFMTGTDGRIPMPPPKDDDVVREYVMPFLPAKLQKELAGKNVPIIYAPYNWALNEAVP